MGKSSKLFVGMDVHKDSIDVATGEESGGEVRHYGAIGGDRAAVARLARKMESPGRKLVFVYEAGPCGFGIYRLLRGRGHECWVVSPGMTPRSNADRVKTDRRDALKLARLARAGELTPIHVPDAQDEAMRDLVRAREDAVIMQRQAREHQRIAPVGLHPIPGAPWRHRGRHHHAPHPLALEPSVQPEPAGPRLVHEQRIPMHLANLPHRSLHRDRLPAHAPKQPGLLCICNRNIHRFLVHIQPNHSGAILFHGLPPRSSVDALVLNLWLCAAHPRNPRYAGGRPPLRVKPFCLEGTRW